MKAYKSAVKRAMTARYVKIVEWSDEEKCYVGSAPGLILGGCHGDDERQVFEELCQIVEEAMICTRRKALPPPTSGAISPTICRVHLTDTAAVPQRRPNRRSMSVSASST